MESDSQQYERYSRQLALKELGEAGQQKLRAARVLVIGAGGLGCAVLQYLAAAGVGCIGIVDDDRVALHNLHRQVLYNVQDIGLYKAERASAVLQLLNPSITIEVHRQRLTTANALGLLAACDIVIDGTDNFSTRYMVNDACVLLGKPLVYGAVSRFEGQVAVFNIPGKDNAAAANYRDLFPDPPAAGEIANCAEAGVLGVLPGIIGAMQANEAIKLVTGMGKPLINTLLTYNALNNQFFDMQLTALPGSRRFIPADSGAFEQTNYDWLCNRPANEFEIDTWCFNKLLQQPGVLAIDVREAGETPVVDEFDHLHMPLSQFHNSLPAEKSDTIVVFCQSGVRSLRAAGLLAAGYGSTKKIFSLAGGILKWKQDMAV